MNSLHWLSLYRSLCAIEAMLKVLLRTTRPQRRKFFYTAKAVIASRSLSIKLKEVSAMLDSEMEGIMVCNVSSQMYDQLLIASVQLEIQLNTYIKNNSQIVGMCESPKRIEQIPVRAVQTYPSYSPAL